MDLRRALGFEFAFDTRNSIRIAMVLMSAVGLMTLVVGIQIFKITDHILALHDVLDASVEQRFQVRSVYGMLRDAEISYSKYELTRDGKDLEHFRQLQIDIPAALDDMLAIFTGSEEQHQRSEEIRNIALNWLNTLDGTIADDPLQSGQTRQFDEALAAVPTRIGDLAARMIAFEENDIMRASQVIDREINNSRTVSIVMLGIIALLVVAVLTHGLAYLSSRARVEVALREANRLAEDASAAKTDFLATMSHEIRTPLTGVLGYTDMLLQEELTDQQRGIADRIQAAGTSLSAIVNDILDFSKIEAGEIAIESKVFSPHQLAENVMSIVAVLAERKNLEVRFDLDPGLPEKLRGDEPHLRQVLLNLMSNAIKFTRVGNVTFKVQHLASTDEGEKIRFEVRDTGVGFGPEKRERLFKRFSQLDSSVRREFGGTGLGLAISKQLVELMGGTIGVDSVEGIGTKFWIDLTLPRATDDDEELEDSLDHEMPGAIGRVLLAEDSTQNQSLISTILSTAGHEVDIAVDGVEALAKVQAEQYDLVLMDVQMPRMDGPTCTIRIRELDHPSSNVPIVALTANVLPQQVNTFRRAGMNDFIPKPFQRTELVSKVAKWVSIGQKARALQEEIAAGDATHNMQTLADVRSLMGDAWVLKGLTGLKNDLGEGFGDGAAAPVVADELRRRAHRIVGHAGQFGFHELSRCCSDLEEACLAGENVEPAYRAAVKASAAALDRIEDLLEAISRT